MANPRAKKPSMKYTPGSDQELEELLLVAHGKNVATSTNAAAKVTL